MASPRLIIAESKRSLDAKSFFDIYFHTSLSDAPTPGRPSQGEQEPESDNQALASRVAGRRGTVPHALVRRVPRLRAAAMVNHMWASTAFGGTPRLSALKEPGAVFANDKLFLHWSRRSCRLYLFPHVDPLPTI